MSKRPKKKAARRNTRRHAGCVAVPKEYWERIVDRLSEAQDLRRGDEAAYVLQCYQLWSDIVAMRVGAVLL